MCKIPFANHHLAAAHKLKEHGSLCAICGKAFPKIVGLEDHMKMVHNIQPRYPCKVCGCKFRKQKNLMKHMLQHESSGSAALVYRCHVCNKAFLEQSTLHIHENIHDDPVNCEFCQMPFPRPSSLKAHKRTVHPDQHKMAQALAREQKMNEPRKFSNRRNKRRRR